MATSSASTASEPTPTAEPPYVDGTRDKPRYNTNGPLISRPRISPSEGWNDNGFPQLVYNDNGAPTWAAPHEETS